MKPPSLVSDSNLIIVKKVQYEKEVQVQKELQPSTEWLYKNLLFGGFRIKDPIFIGISITGSS